MESERIKQVREWSAAAQRTRRLELAALIRSQLRPRLDDQGNADHLLWWDQDRVALWASNAFFLGDREDIAFANTILRYVRDGLNPQPGPNVFAAAAWAGLLTQHAGKLDVDTHQFGLQFLRDNLPHGCTADFQFHGYNDNMPVMWTWALLAGGHLLNEPRFTAIARANLYQLRDLLRRRGAPSEFGMGYSTHRLTGIAHLAGQGWDCELRTVARQIEARLWAELAGHWSPAMAQFGGASMRGGVPWQPESSALLRQVFGDAICIPAMPWRDWYTEGPRAAAKELGVDPDRFLMVYMHGYGAEFAAATYHVPTRIAALFYAKAAPFTCRCTAEGGYVNGGIYCKQEPVYGNGGILITTRLTNEAVTIKDYPQTGAQPYGIATHHGTNYVVGSASGNLFTTSHAFRCSYRRRPEARTPADYGDILIRYNLNGKVPGGRLKNRYWKDAEHHDEAENYCRLPRDLGTHHCLQEGGTVLCLSTPEPYETWQVQEMRLDICLNQEFGKIGHLCHDGRPVTAYPFETATAGLITLDEGAVFMAFHPLVGRHLERICGLRIRQINEFLVISLYNLEGEPRTCTPHEMVKLGNGFVFEIAEATECADFATFQRQMAAAQVADLLYGGRRRVHYQRPGRWLACQYCPYTKTTVSDAIDGQELRTPHFAYSDGRHRGLPFLAGRPVAGEREWNAWIATQMGRAAETYNPVD